MIIPPPPGIRRTKATMIKHNAVRFTIQAYPYADNELRVRMWDDNARAETWLNTSVLAEAIIQFLDRVQPVSYSIVETWPDTRTKKYLTVFYGIRQ